MYFKITFDVFILLLQGPLTISIQELDGTFNHKIMIEENKTKFEFTCHSKSRRSDFTVASLFWFQKHDEYLECCLNVSTILNLTSIILLLLFLVEVVLDKERSQEIPFR